MSTNQTFLKRTICKPDGSRYKELYQRETKLDVINDIEDRSVNWKLKIGKRGYYIQVQRNAENRGTGNIKVVPQEFAKLVQSFFSIQLSADKEKCLYYVRKRG